jgi:hypothetical protein
MLEKVIDIEMAGAFESSMLGVACGRNAWATATRRRFLDALLAEALAPVDTREMEEAK